MHRPFSRTVTINATSHSRCQQIICGRPGYGKESVSRCEITRTASDIERLSHTQTRTLRHVPFRTRSGHRSLGHQGASSHSAFGHPCTVAPVGVVHSAEPPQRFNMGIVPRLRQEARNPRSISVLNSMRPRPRLLNADMVSGACLRPPSLVGNLFIA